MSELNTKTVSAELIRMLNVDEDAFDYEAYALYVERYVSGLLAEMGSRVNARTSDQQLTSLLKEYCQRGDAVCSRVINADTDIRPQFPLFTGIVFAAYLHRLKKSDNVHRLLPTFKAALKQLPYGNNRMIQVLIDDIERKAQAESLNALNGECAEIDRVLAEVKTKHELGKAVERLSRKHVTNGRIMLHLYLAVGRAATRLEASRGEGHDSRV